jgi:ribosomal protein S18 acetylase RimI-like enzyme
MVMEDIQIGKIGMERFADFRALRLEGLKSVSEAFGSSYEEESAFPDEVWKSRIPNMLFAIYKNSLIGMIGFLARGRVKTRHVTDIFSFYVMKQYQGFGVGSRLMEEALSCIIKSDYVKKISLSVNCEMKAAIHLYTRFGFEISGKLIGELSISGQLYNEFIMEKFV